MKWTNFDMMRLRNLVTKAASWNPRTSHENYVIKYIDISSVDRNSKTVSTPTEIYTHDAPSRARQMVESNDVIVSTVRPNLNAVALIGPDLDGSTASTGYCVLRPKPQQLDSTYLFIWVRSRPFVCDMIRKATGASYPAVSDRIILDSFIPIPFPENPKRSLSEQKRIAAILDQADVIRKKRHQAIDELNTLIPSVFYSMFGDPGSKPKGWEIVKIQRLLDEGKLSVHKDGNYGSSYPRSHEFGNDGIPFLTAKSFSDDGRLIEKEVALLNRKKAKTFTYGWIQDGDILLAHNATVGRVAYYHGDFEKALIGTSLTCFRPNPKHITSAYLYSALKSDTFQNQLQKKMGQTTRNQVPITAQREMSIALPPVEAQKEYNKYLVAYENLYEKHVSSYNQMEDQFYSLVQLAFKGEL